MGSFMVTQCLVVMQPTFLPWAGYFNLIAQSSNFVFLDDVQLEKQSWQTRNRLFIAGQPRWISVPIRHTCLSQTIAETEVVDATHWRDKLARGFAINYGRHHYYTDALEVMDFLLAQQITRLAELNEIIIRFIVSRLKLTAKLHQASKIETTSGRTERLIAFCNHFDAHEYLSPAGAGQYLQDDGFTTRTTSKLRIQNYIPKPYPQKGSEAFHSHLSIIDVIANLGWDHTNEYIQKGV